MRVWRGQYSMFGESGLVAVAYGRASSCVLIVIVRSMARFPGVIGTPARYRGLGLSNALYFFLLILYIHLRFLHCCKTQETHQPIALNCYVSLCVLVSFCLWWLYKNDQMF